jgi:hypothetical protein
MMSVRQLFPVSFSPGLLSDSIVMSHECLFCDRRTYTVNSFNDDALTLGQQSTILSAAFKK